jgi:uncharacterized membrane protein
LESSKSTHIFSRKVSVFLKTRLRNITHLDTEKKILLLSIVIYTVVMACFSIMRMYALKASAWDLGNYNQAMHTFVFEGKLFYLTPELQNNPSGSVFGIHFSPIFFLQAPLYLLYPGPEMLLVIQSSILALGVVPTYLISCEYFESRKIRLLLCAAYIVNPAILGISVFDFHPEMYIPTFYLFMVYFYIKHNWKGTWLFSLLLMSTIEFAPTLTFLFGVYFFLKDIVWSTFIRKKKSLDKKLAINLVVLVIVSIIWLFAALRVIGLFSPNVPLTQGKTELWPTLGASNLSQVPITALMNPSNAFNALLFDGTAKVAYLVASSISWILLPLFSIEFWFLSSSWLFPALLSSNSAFYTIGLHYPSFFAGQLTYTGITMFKKVFSKFRINWQILASFILLGVILSNPFLSLNFDTNPWVGYGFPTLSEKALAVSNLMTLLPPEASVLATQNIFPLVSSRLNAYTIPWQINFNSLSFFDYIDNQVKKVDYVFMDTDSWKPLSAVLLSKTVDFGVIGYENNILLLKRGYQAAPKIYKPLSYSFNYRDLTVVSGSIIPDEQSQSGKVLLRPSTAPAGSDFWWGPWIYICTPGEYEVTFWIKTNVGYIGRIMALDSVVFPEIVVGKIHGDEVTGYYQTLIFPPKGGEKQATPYGINLYGEMLKPREYTPITFGISANISGNYEFRGMDVTLDATIYLDRIDLTMIKPYPFTEPVEIQTQFNGFNPIPFDTQDPPG